MMENQYFAPSIEDIRVGYECECLWCCQEPRPWWSIKVLEEDLMDTKSLPIEQVYRRIKNNEIRVPYLTKEQIEAEGWKNITNSINLNAWSFEKDNRFIVIKMNDSQNPFILQVIVKDPSKEELVFGVLPEHFRFIAPCKDINTFRYICKLLGI